MIEWWWILVTVIATLAAVGIVGAALVVWAATND